MHTQPTGRAAFICSHLAEVEFIAFAEGPAKSQGVT